MLTKKITLLAISLVIFLPNIALAEQDVIINNSTVEVRNGKAKTTTEQNRVINKQESIINNDDDDDEKTSDKGDEVKAGKVKVTRDKNGDIKVETGNSTVKVDSNSRTSIRRNNRQPNLNNNKPSESVTKSTETATNKTTNTTEKNTTVNTTTIKKGNNTVINSKITCNSNKQQSTQITKIVGSGKKVIKNNTSVVKCP